MHVVYPKHDSPLAHSLGDPLLQRLWQDVDASSRDVPQKKVSAELCTPPPPLPTGEFVVMVVMESDATGDSVSTLLENDGDKVGTVAVVVLSSATFPLVFPDAASPQDPLTMKQLRPSGQTPVRHRMPVPQFLMASN